MEVAPRRMRVAVAAEHRVSQSIGGNFAQESAEVVVPPVGLSVAVP